MVLRKKTGKRRMMLKAKKGVKGLLIGQFELMEESQKKGRKSPPNLLHCKDRINIHFKPPDLARTDEQSRQTLLPIQEERSKSLSMRTCRSMYCTNLRAQQPCLSFVPIAVLVFSSNSIIVMVFSLLPTELLNRPASSYSAPGLLPRWLYQLSRLPTIRRLGAEGRLGHRPSRNLALRGSELDTYTLLVLREY
jgi:hypothetical protein